VAQTDFKYHFKYPPKKMQSNPVHMK